ncbi:hypothetical protein SPI_05202 [Niveomyces insectorum RCEF 264]|uniref:Uncharacterized protein n=1 Tax=Niveomyces insectorum RCEF 264 TaxID=1081102 RepID=A0A167U2G2_9HYPO|nr:hypothetical protein SPI_05202 [Niveomyces insectorum RCEF 264]
MLPAIKHGHQQNLLSREALPNGRIIERYDGVTLVEDPNVDIFNEEERLKLLAEMRAPTGALALDLGAVNKRLSGLSKRSRSRSRTPSDASTISASSFNEEEAKASLIEGEKKHRALLLEHGFPPCHPPEYAYPFANEESRPKHLPAALYYMEGDLISSDWPIGSQTLDLKLFLGWQKDRRSYCVQRPRPPHAMDLWMEQGRRLLRAHGFPEAAASIDWTLDAKDQSRLQNWTEFQVYEIVRYENKTKVAEQRVRHAYDEDNRRWRKVYEERRLELHRGLLAWMEEHRVRMAQEEREAKAAAPAAQETEAHASDAPPPERRTRSAAAAVSPLSAGAGRSLRARRTRSAAAAAINAAATKPLGRRRVEKKTTTTTTTAPPRQAHHKHPNERPHCPWLEAMRPISTTTTPPERPSRAAPRRQQQHRDGSTSPRRLVPNVAQRHSNQSVPSRISKGGQGRRSRAVGSPPVQTRSGRLVRKPVRYGWVVA